MTRIHLITGKVARRTGLLFVLAGLLAAMVAPAQGLAKAPVKFGSKLNPTVQPSNSLPGYSCNGFGEEEEVALAGPACTMVQEEAYGRPEGGHIAPKSGRIRVIRVIAGGPGSFRPQIVKVRHSASTLLGDTKAKVIRTGRTLTYTGQSEENWEEDRYKVEKFKVNIPVKKGQQLALLGDTTSMLRCSSGGHNTLVFSPGLRKRAPFQGATDASGCWILMEAVIR